MESPRLYILDFDGTLADTAGVILRTLRATFREMGLPERSDAEYRSTIGLPLEQCFPALVPMSHEQSLACAATYRRIFPRMNTEDAVVLYPHVFSALTTLKGRGATLTIASSRSHDSLDDYVSRFGLQPLVRLVVGADDVKAAKPDPEPVNRILRALSFRPQQTLVVGDAPYDILMGRRAGCCTCAVTYGNGRAEDLTAARPDYVADDFAQILTLG